MAKAALGILVVALALVAGAPAAHAADLSRHGEMCAGGGHPSRGDVPTPPDDQDCDSIKDGVDNCPPSGANDFTTRNPDQTDSDNDGLGDKCDGDDDNDGIADASDNCRTVANPGQADANGDGIGDACVVDTDHDGLIDPKDNCPRRMNPDQVDTDLDGLGDACDNDDDEDFIADNAPDNCRLTPNQDQADGDGDGVGTACDADESPFGPGTGGGGGAQPPPPPPTATIADRTAPTVRLSVARKAAFAELGGGLVATVRCSEACIVKAELRLGKRQARKLRLSRARPVARGSATLAAAGRTYAFLRFERRAKRRLWRARRVTTSLRVTVADAAGNRRTLTRSVKLHR